MIKLFVCLLLVLTFSANAAEKVELDGNFFKVYHSKKFNGTITVSLKYNDVIYTENNINNIVISTLKKSSTEFVHSVDDLRYSFESTLINTLDERFGTHADSFIQLN